MLPAQQSNLPIDLSNPLVLYSLIGGGVLLGVMVLAWLIAKLRKKPRRAETPDLMEDLDALPPAPARTGDRRLVIEGLPVRLRMVIIAPAGTMSTVTAEMVPGLLEQVVIGLEDVCDIDKPVIRVWPRQMSYEGFANQCHRCTPIPEGERKQSPWIVLAGRAKMGPNQIMVGMVAKSMKPNTVGRRTLDTHQWMQVARVRVRD
jgi:hypothetical protein